MDYVKVLIYGVPGAGKTYLAGSAADVPEMSPVLFIDMEGGTKTIRNLWPDVSVVRIRDRFDDKGRLKKSAWQILQDVYEDLKKGVGKYKTIVIDSLSEAQKVSMYSVMSGTTEKDPERDPDIPAMRDWGKSGEQMRRFVRAFRDLDCHVIFTALANDNKDQMTGKVSVKPSLPGKLADEIPAYLDEVLYLYTRATKDGIDRKLLSEPTEKYSAKDRSGNLPTTITNPLMATVAAHILDSSQKPVPVPTEEPDVDLSTLVQDTEGEE